MIKKTKYDLLADQLRLMYKLKKVKVIPYVMAFDSTVSKNHIDYCKYIGINKKIDAYVQTRVMKLTTDMVTNSCERSTVCYKKHELRKNRLELLKQANNVQSKEMMKREDCRGNDYTEKHHEKECNESQEPSAKRMCPDINHNIAISVEVPERSTILESSNRVDPNINEHLTSSPKPFPLQSSTLKKKISKKKKKGKGKLKN